MAHHIPADDEGWGEESTVGDGYLKKLVYVSDVRNRMLPFDVRVVNGSLSPTNISHPTACHHQNLPPMSI
eukprot:CAMPEP_0171304174 /NCGR_PEP_ID=MMETSP0816-20121228/13877_1 /TAXON_ID=420281 /ORGANISM="Proboscia inermis, Strain CCAP1064/1" /LENGTH=69 /DNA_ID=CAMNT_0011784073 /DNA_START=402 /DNA_END=611 /DNA_ORIENTATION=-